MSLTTSFWLIFTHGIGACFPGFDSSVSVVIDRLPEFRARPDIRATAKKMVIFSSIKKYSRVRLLLLHLVVVVILTGCGTSDYKIQSLAKTDIDMVADTNVEAIQNLLETLTVKLYSRNPRELRKVQGISVQDRLDQLLHSDDEQNLKELKSVRSVDAMLLAFDPNYAGDRVFALMAGLTTMLDDAYNNQREFFITSKMDQQKLYNSARNIEVLVWRLNSRRDEQGDLYLLTNATNNTVNLSFERLFGKLIARQDMMAELVAQKTNRTITRVVQGLATMAFVPI